MSEQNPAAGGREVIPVVIVGGGPVGLALACDLGWRGIPCLLIDKGEGVNRHPRANVLHIRSQELLRRWGLIEEILRAGYPTDYPADFIFTTRITRHEVHRFSFPSYRQATEQREAFSHRFPDIAHSPGYKYYIGQNALEPILRRRAEACPHVQVNYGWRLSDFEQDDGGVTATLERAGGGEPWVVRARYLVGCDGGRSTVREALNIQLSGMGDFGRQVGIYFRAPEFYDRQPHGRCALYWAMAPGATGVFIPIDGKELFNFQRHLVGEESAAGIDARATIEASFGQPLDVEVLTTQEWSAHALVAERYRDGRVFLAGDAAHLFVPTGGFGMNTGLSDAADLGWRLAGTLSGWGGPGLLDAYDVERRPVAVRNAREAADNYLELLPCMLTPPTIENEDEIGAILRGKYAKLLSKQRKHFNAIGISLGYRYDPSPLIVPDGTPPLPDDPEEYVPNARPGARAPYVPMAEGDSTLDRLGRDFTLFRLGAEPADATALVDAASASGVPLSVVDIVDPAARELYAAPLVLIRPDGHVAWRGTTPVKAAAIIDTVRGFGEAASAARAAVA